MLERMQGMVADVQVLFVIGHGAPSRAGMNSTGGNVQYQANSAARHAVTFSVAQHVGDGVLQRMFIGFYQHG